MTPKISRRRMLQLGGSTVLTAALAPRFSFAADRAPAENPHGVVVSEVNGSRVGNEVLAGGGNAIDAIVAAALTSAVTAVSSCGIGGYGGVMMIALAGGKKTTAIDFNTTAPAAARPDMFPVDAKGLVIGRVNNHGWLASGVPGTLAGLQYAIDHYGTRSFRELAAPAIKLAKDGFPTTPGLAGVFKSAAAQLKKDPGSNRLFYPNGVPLQAGETLRNPALAAMLETLAGRNSVDSFYRGDIAQVIAGEFKQNGGLVTAADLAAYRVREVAPLELTWLGHTIKTVPLTAGGLTVLQTLAILKAMKWEKLPAGFARSHARLEALRLAWYDRLNLFADTTMVSVPVKKLLSADYAHELAERALAAVKAGQPIPQKITSRDQTGTIHLSASDRHGNLAALTLTHGNGLGAQVTVDGLGLVLGHGMSRFEPDPKHPNAIAPGKRPLHNMCPTIVLRDGKPIVALGASGGRKIPNSIFDVLTHRVVHGTSLSEAVAAPRLNTEGTLELMLEKTWPSEEIEAFKKIGYTHKTSGSATVSAVEFNPKTGACQASWR
jgi:gamma-glutamyltranspeptidase/glutathione hydrolase